ncbi:aspartic proteinase CDR1-like [Tripterygium wilfordii]|uniref:Aspartic proteinase CDR1-like n=2 Tax=Tripterygium wilfordii TaxID=458696 RepID=A0A7J7BVG1_TRIWF|nr:aspartic proteinase CDR1-like [Tripterygium wilfordii]
MAMVSANTIYSFLFFITLARHALPTITKPRRFVTKLVHRDNVLSPYYNPIDSAKQDIESSITRFAYLSAIESGTHDKHTTPTAADRGLFYVEFSIGQPPFSQLAVMDTGSSLIWVNCLTCDLCSQEENHQIFDPSKSSTYTPMPCKPYHCPSCSWENKCMFKIRYVRGIGLKGILSKEQLTCSTSDGDTNIISNVTIGCAESNRLDIDQDNRGVFGLAMDETRWPTSLVTQMGSKFSYCIGNMNDPNYAYNRLIIGDGAVMEGYSTPLEVYKAHYYVKMVGISLGEKDLDINPNVFRKTPDEDNGVVIDSGSAYTWLAGKVYDELRFEVQSLLETQLQEYRYVARPWQLCYIGSVSRDLAGFPVVTFRFADGADLGLDVGSLFSQVSRDVFCMAVGPSYVNGNSRQKLSVIGMMAQQQYNVGFDLNSKMLFFQRIECELLDD